MTEAHPNILVVVTEDGPRRSIVSELRTARYNVLEATNTLQAVAMTEELTSEDLILCEIISNKEYTDVIRSYLKMRREIPVVFLVGNADKETLEPFLERSPHFVEKPVDVSELTSTIERALAQARHSQISTDQK